MTKPSNVTRRTAIRVAIAGAAAVATGAARARLSDPEGNPIQLWQPGGTDPG